MVFEQRRATLRSTSRTQERRAWEWQVRHSTFAQLFLQALVAKQDHSRAPQNLMKDFEMDTHFLVTNNLVRQETKG
jgi:hypothetical protein